MLVAVIDQPRDFTFFCSNDYRLAVIAPFETPFHA
jgi:hypothetical protein